MAQDRSRFLFVLFALIIGEVGLLLGIKLSKMQRACSARVVGVRAREAVCQTSLRKFHRPYANSH